MKREMISETIGNINSKYIDEATEYKGREKNFRKKLWYKWAAAAACFTLVLAAGVLLTGALSVSSDPKQIADTALMIEYENAYFEIIENPTALKRFGLEEEITQAMTGSHITYLKNSVPEDERSIYIAADGETQLQLFEYAPAPYKAVRIFRDGDKYFYALFCNYLMKSDESLPIQDAFEVYGIDKASDIACITPVKSDNSWESNGRPITDSAVISEFFHEISQLPAFGFDGFHESVFADELKKLEGTGGDIGSEAYTRVADDRRDIVIETKDRLRFCLHYYPSYGWIAVSATMTYYPMSPEIREWFDNYISPTPPY